MSASSTHNPEEIMRDARTTKCAKLYLTWLADLQIFAKKGVAAGVEGVYTLAVLVLRA
jgi:hypothetical protein